MLDFATTIKRFGKMGEKTGWTYVEIPASKVSKLKPGTKVSFRVKGTIDSVKIAKLALIPMGNGSFILPLKADLRKKIGKEIGAKVTLSLQPDTQIKLSPELIACLEQEPEAKKYFNSLPGSHQRWFSNWVTAAKTITTRERRIVTILKSCLLKRSFPEMMRLYRSEA